MKLQLSMIAALVAAGLSQPAAARDPLVLEASSAWELDYAADSCALRRNFGEGDQRTQLEMRRFQPGIGLQATVVTKATKMARRNFRYRLDPAGEWKDVDMPIYAHFADKFEGVIFSFGLVEAPLEGDSKPEEWAEFFQTVDFRSLEAEAAGTVQSITLSRAFKDDLVLKTGSLKAPLIALSDCVNELTTHWGIDVEAHKTRTRSAVPVTIARVSRMLDYPPRMLRENLPGLVNIRLDVDETGVVTDCHIQMPLSDPEFEKESCTKVKRGLKFDPALDKDGNPMKSYYVTSVRFQIR